jgi:hypothetical protein
VIRRFWVSTPMLRLGCLPLDVMAGLLLAVGRASRWVERQRAAL